MIDEPAAHMVAPDRVWYNLVKLYKAHRTTPAIAAEVTDRAGSVDDIVALIEAQEATGDRSLLVG